MLGKWEKGKRCCGGGYTQLFSGIACSDVFLLTVPGAGGRVLLPAKWEKGFVENQGL